MAAGCVVGSTMGDAMPIKPKKEVLVVGDSFCAADEKIDEVKMEKSDDDEEAAAAAEVEEEAAACFSRAVRFATAPTSAGIRRTGDGVPAPPAADAPLLRRALERARSIDSRFLPRGDRRVRGAPGDLRGLRGLRGCLVAD